MKIYTGIDIVENSRIEKAYSRFKEKFFKKSVHTKRNWVLPEKNDFIPCLAARFAAKEATIKAYYQLSCKNLRYKDIEILGKKGAPAEILLHNDIYHTKNLNISISISHEKNYSVAVVIIYTA